MVYIAIIALFLSVGIAGFVVGMSKHIKLIEESVETLHSVDAHTQEIQWEAISRLTESYSKMQKIVDELPVEELTKEAEKMAAWNSGVEEIVSFGKNIPKINKEGLKHE